MIDVDTDYTDVFNTKLSSRSLLQVITETAVFCMDEGEWKLLASHSNWDRNKLQATVA